MVRPFFGILLVLVATFLASNHLKASGYDEGRAFADGQIGNLSNMAKDEGFNQEIPNFTASPAEANLNDQQIRQHTDQIKSGTDDTYSYISGAKKTRDKKFADDMKFQDEAWFKDSLDVVKGSDKRILQDCKNSPIDNNDPTLKTYKVMVEEIKTITDSKTCEETTIVENSCEKELKIRCEYNSLCNSGGIVLSSIDTDMKWEYSNDHFILGTISDNYWGGYCATYDRTTKFEIKNVDKIHEFKIVEEGFDDYLWVKINDTTVYIGPDGGDKLEVQERTRRNGRRHRKYNVVYNGHSDQACERNTSRVIHQEIDLKSYLKNGQNEVFMRTIVSGGGEAWIKIRAKQFCCGKWIESWEDNCEELKK